MAADRRLRWGLLVLVMIAGCSKKNATALDRVKDAVGSADALKPTDGSQFSAQRCEAGVIDGISVLLCEYPSMDASARGKHAAEKWLGESPTGVVLTNSSVLLAAADREHKDPKGKSIQQLGKRFLEAKPDAK